MELVKHLKSIRVAHKKNTAGFAVAALPLPPEVRIPLCQHVGKPCEPLVFPGDHVLVGQKIGDSEDRLSAPVHSSVSGTVIDMIKFPDLDGNIVDHIVIATDGKQEPAPDIKPPVINTTADFVAAVKASGIVGLGGAGFPMAAKYDIMPGSIDTFIINGAESEPYITADHMTMMVYAREILDGIHTIMKWLRIGHSIIAIQTDKPDAIKQFEELIAEKQISDISVVSLPDTYPQGEEHSIVFSCTGRRFPAGKRTNAVGVLVSNVCSVLKLQQYLTSGMPLMSRAITLDGDIVAKPQNVEVPVGTTVRDILEGCGGVTEEIGKILIGGPLTGIAVPTDEYPITKRDHAVICLSRAASTTIEETACIRCDRCVKACPMDLVPFEIADAWDRRDLEAVKRLRADHCMGCNSCSFICPARRHLGYRIKNAKEAIRNAEQ